MSIESSITLILDDLRAIKRIYNDMDEVNRTEDGLRLHGTEVILDRIYQEAMNIQECMSNGNS